MKSLVLSDVVFDSEHHTYYLYGHVLKGITPIVSWVYPETYQEIPQSVLMKAAERGTNVHRDCNLVDMGFEPETDEAKAYKVILQQSGLKARYSEWIVDDGQDIATAIDVVFEDGSIGDYKTTSKIHRDNVTLQLSICAMLLEGMNPDLHVPHLYVIWLPKKQYGEPELMELQRIPKAVCEKIVRMYLDGDDNTEARALLHADVPAEVDTEKKLPERFYELQQEIIKIEQQKKECEDREKELRDGLLQLMIEKDVKKWEGDCIILTRKDASVRESIDTAKVKKEYPDVYYECVKRTNVKPSLMIKIKS